MKIKATIALLIAASAGAHAAAIHNGLVNYWTLDGNGQDSASDIAGSTSTVEDDLTVEGTAGAVTIAASGGLFGGAADFERGVADNGSLSANSADTNFDGVEVTVSLWAQFEDNSSNWQSLVSSGEGTNYRIARRSGDNRLAAAFGTADAQGVNGTPDINSGEWLSVVATSSLNEGVYTTSLYINGLLEATNSTGTGILATGGFDLLIGNNPEATGRQWDGLIDDVAVWDRALTLAEVQEINTAGLAGISLGAIPEPSSGLLLGLGGLMVALRRRR